MIQNPLADVRRPTCAPFCPEQAVSTAGAVVPDNYPALLLRRAEAEAHAIAATFLGSGAADQEAFSWTYLTLARKAAAIADALAAHGAAGKRILLLYEPGLEFIAAFFGVLQTGAIAVPSFPPLGTRALNRIANIVGDAKPEMVLSTASMGGFEERLRALCGPSHDFAWLATDALEPATQLRALPPLPPDALAMLQYTSGSTGHPKGVMISHGNLMSNGSALLNWMGPAENRVGCSWLPPYHDMGLMGGILLPIYAGFPVVLMAPSTFVQRPIRWLRAISDYGVTTTVSPNFALDLCVTGIDDDELEGIDLSTVQDIFCGAEPIRKSTFDRFHQRYTRHGFRYEAFNPCFGLAEATLFVSGKPQQTAPRHRHFDLGALETRRVAAVDAQHDNARALMSCGRIAQQHEVRIVDADTLQPCADDVVGEIWISGPNVAQGYWKNEAASQDTFRARIAGDAQTYLRTGDFGFLHDGELYITGRLKDVIIIAGRNHYPQDIELTAQGAHTDVRLNGVAAFPIDTEKGEALVVVAEVRRSTRSAPVNVAEVRTAILTQVTAVHGVRPHEIHVGPMGTLPLTTSGKVQRRQCKQLFLAGSLPVMKQSSPEL